MQNRLYIGVPGSGQAVSTVAVPPKEKEVFTDSAYNSCSIQANLKYFHNFLVKQGSVGNTISSYLMSVGRIIPCTIRSLWKTFRITRPVQLIQEFMESTNMQQGSGPWFRAIWNRLWPRPPHCLQAALCAISAEALFSTMLYANGIVNV